MKQAARKARASKRKAKPERSAEERAAFGQIRDTYFAAFEQKTGGKLESFDAADGDAIYKLLAKVKGNAGSAIRYVKNAVLSDFGGSLSIRTIASDPKRFAVLNKRANGSGRGGVHQPVEGDGYGFEEFKVQ